MTSDGGLPAYLLRMYESERIYGGGSVLWDMAKSGTALAERRPALRWPRPSICPEASRRGRFCGRAEGGFAPLVVGGLEGWRTADGARFADMDGDGED
jgi:hypothetical protein